LTDTLRGQEPFFQIAVVQLQIEAQQHTGGQLGQCVGVWAIGMRIGRQCLLCQGIGNLSELQITTLSLGTLFSRGQRYRLLAARYPVVPHLNELCNKATTRPFCKNVYTFCLDGFMSSLPPYLRTFCPRKSKPSSM